MKKLPLLIYVVFIFSTANSYAAILTINNSNPSPGQYNSIAVAMTAAADGDTLLITGTPNSYGRVTVTKPITLMGNGFYPAKQIRYGTVLNDILINTNVHDVNILGLDIFYVNTQDNVDNVNIRYCLVRDNIYFNKDCNNWVIKNNVLLNINNNSVTGCSNLLVENNIIQRSIQGFVNSINVIIQNNIFISPNSYLAFEANANNLIVANNIFYNIRPYAPLNTIITNVSFSNNISYRQGTSNPFPPNGVDGNTVTGSFVDTDPLFENYDGQFFSFAHNYRLKSNSVGHNGGLDGTDIGVFGRGNIFSMTGEPNIPSVRTFSILNPVTTSGGAINITVTASKARVD